MDRARGLFIGHAIGTAIGNQTKMRQKSDGAMATFPSQVSYRGRPPCAWSAVTDVMLVMANTDNTADLAADLVELAKFSLDYLPDGGMSSFERAVVESAEFDRDPAAAAELMWQRSANRATYSEPVAYAVMGGFVQGAVLLYASPRSRFAASVMEDIMNVMLSGGVGTRGDIDALVARIATAAASASPHITPAGIYRTFDEEVADAIRIGYTDRIELLHLDRPGSLTDPIKALGCAAYVLRCIRYSLEFNTIPSFRKILLKIADECGNADVNTGIAGAILGSFLGYSLLPPQWVNALHNVSHLRALVDGILTRKITPMDEPDTAAVVDVPLPPSLPPPHESAEDLSSVSSLVTMDSSSMGVPVVVPVVAESRLAESEPLAIAPILSIPDGS
jgi:hypothetical protein